MKGFEKLIEFDPAYVKRHTDPSKNYGIHCLTLRMVLKGEKGAVQFVLYTGWFLPHVREELQFKERFLSEPLPADVGYHSPMPMYEGQKSIIEQCAYLDGHPCYYDGSALTAEKAFDILVEQGGDGVWKYLEDYYHDTFGNEKEE